MAGSKSFIPGKTPEEKEVYIQKYFREVFGSAQGKAVLNILLTDLHYFDICEDAEDMYLSNFAKHLLSNRMGLKDTVAITDCLFNGAAE